MRATIVILITFLLPAVAGTRPLALDDQYRWQTVGDPRISPDGAWVAYSVSTPQRATDSDDSAIWLVSWDGTQTRRVTEGTATVSSPQWSRDGRSLAFLSDGGDANAS